MDEGAGEKEMNVMDFVKTKRSKKDDLPGKVESQLEEFCPLCGKQLRLIKPCCMSKKRKKECICGWKQYLE